jgi:hypothetical protein
LEKLEDYFAVFTRRERLGDFLPCCCVGIHRVARLAYTIPVLPTLKTDVTPALLLYLSGTRYYVGVLISLWIFLFPIFLFAAQTK